MDVNKNGYTFGFAAAMVIVVAAILSFAATSLQPLQQKNISLEKKQSILASIGVKVERDAAEKAYDEYISEALVLNNGQEVSGLVAFDVELSKEIVKEPSNRNAPLYIANKDGERYFIIPLRGKGLWGPIWGYLALEGDVNTVYGATFDHKSETPGLGAEISTPVFMDQFPGKKILDEDGDFVSIEVRKGDASGVHEVDGISGGTITSVGVQDMIQNSVKPYLEYLKKYKTNAQAAASLDNEKEIASIQ